MRVLQWPALPFPLSKKIDLFEYLMKTSTRASTAGKRENAHGALIINRVRTDYPGIVIWQVGIVTRSQRAEARQLPSLSDSTLGVTGHQFATAGGAEVQRFGIGSGKLGDRDVTWGKCG